MNEITPLPWKAGWGEGITGPNAARMYLWKGKIPIRAKSPLCDDFMDPVAAVHEGDPCAEANAAYIVEACNAYPALTARVEALEEALRESVALNENYHAVEEHDGYEFTEAPKVIAMGKAALKEPK